MARQAEGRDIIRIAIRLYLLKVKSEVDWNGLSFPCFYSKEAT